IEPIPSGNLSPGFDPSTCHSVYVGNIHSQVTEPLLQEVFASTGLVKGQKVRRTSATASEYDEDVSAVLKSAILDICFLIHRERSCSLAAFVIKASPKVMFFSDICDKSAAKDLAVFVGKVLLKIMFYSGIFSHKCRKI
ncbi:hypothetical protein Goshw_003460, partial [Gossypium schwendimanii]|nr:hypothetical protein [Gossypium schwendimanii]